MSNVSGVAPIDWGRIEDTLRLCSERFTLQPIAVDLYGCAITPKV